MKVDSIDLSSLLTILICSYGCSVRVKCKITFSIQNMLKFMFLPSASMYQIVHYTGQTLQIANIGTVAM